MVFTKLTAKLFGKNKLSAKALDPDERWSNLYREREKNSIYKWVGSMSGGELVSVYEKEGEDGVLNFAQEKLEPMLYNEGHAPQLIKWADYARWKKSINVILGIIEDKEISESNSYFREHEAQTRLNKRGVEGETLVHLLLNRKEPTCREIARILINKYPGIAKDIYLGEEMFGQSSLHLAIVHEDFEMVNLLLEMGSSVHARATGDFFMPEDYEKNARKTLDYNGYAYYGEYPLAFAACFEHKDIYDLLIQFGADPDQQDKFGNTVLHMCVIYNKSTMYRYAVSHWSNPAHTYHANNAGHTPLTLATKLGQREIFDEMLELMKVEFWRFSDMTCSAYPLDALDTIRLDGTTNFDSALMTVVNGDSADHLEMIGSEVIQRLLKDKWNAFAKRKLFERLLLLLLQLFNLSFVVYLRPVALSKLYMVEPDLWDWIRSLFELLGILCCFWFLFVQQLSDVRNQGIYAYYQNIKTAPAKVVYICANLCFLACVPTRILGLHELEECLLSFALPGSWTFLLFFLSSTKVIGPFVQIFYDMLSKDIVRYAIISSIFLVAFSEVFYFLGKDANAIQSVSAINGGQCNTGGKIYSYDSFFDSFLTLYSLMVQASAMNFDEYSCTNYVTLGKLTLIIYLAIIPIMMMSILIAMMEETYIEVIGHAEKAWKQQYAKLIMVFERSLESKKLVAHLMDYSIRMGKLGRESRGLMVIKQTTKTRAFQRKHAIKNWKTMARKVITMAKELGADATLYFLHSFDQMAKEETVGVGLGTGYGNAPWRTRPQSIARSSPGGGRAKDEWSQDGQGMNSVEILQIEHDDSIRERSGQLQLSFSYSRIDNNSGRVKLSETRRELTIDGAVEQLLANGLPDRLSTSEIRIRVPHDGQFVQLTKRHLFAQKGSKCRGVAMLPSDDVPNMPATHPLHLTSSPEEDEAVNRTEKNNLFAKLQKSASTSTISTFSSSEQWGE
uniref:Ion transport domain-containing protein n=1 Tax=Globodera rostochiensis TaxID=31243 RepID=A0A914H3C0_GLORO